MMLAMGVGVVKVRGGGGVGWGWGAWSGSDQVLTDDLRYIYACIQAGSTMSLILPPS